MVALASSRFQSIPTQIYLKATVDSVSGIRHDIFWRPSREYQSVSTSQGVEVGV